MINVEPISIELNIFGRGCWLIIRLSFQFIYEKDGAEKPWRNGLCCRGWSDKDDDDDDHDGRDNDEYE